MQFKCQSPRVVSPVRSCSHLMHTCAMQDATIYHHWHRFSCIRVRFLNKWISNFAFAFDEQQFGIWCTALAYQHFHVAEGAKKKRRNKGALSHMLVNGCDSWELPSQTHGTEKIPLLSTHRPRAHAHAHAHHWRAPFFLSDDAKAFPFLSPKLDLSTAMDTEVTPNAAKNNMKHNRLQKMQLNPDLH